MYNTKITLLDSATGTNLHKAGMPQGVCTETWILEHAEVLQKLQKKYCDAGSDIIYAPTFGANRATLSRYDLGDKTVKINTQLVALTKNAVGDFVKVTGGMSPTGLFLEPFGDTTVDELLQIYKEQAEALFNAGVDLFVIETMLNLAEARIAVLAIKEVCDLPIFVTMTVHEKGKTLSGNDVLSCLVILQSLGIAAFGFNCSTGPDSMIESFKEIAPYAKVPLIAKPNAGMPHHVDGHIEFDLSAEEFSEFAVPLINTGVQIIGSCCGSDPEYIKLIKEKIVGMEPASIEKSDDLIMANDKDVFFIDNVIDMSEQFKVLEIGDVIDDIGLNILRVLIKDEEDLSLFIEDAYLISNPICISCNDEEILEKALRSYCGRVFVDIICEIERETLERIAKKYGAIVR